MEGGTDAMSTLISSLVTGFTTMAGNILDAIGQIVPVLLPIFAAFAVVYAGLRIARKLRNG